MPTIEVASDAQLVAACLGGDRDAFGRIVERYQRLLCSLAYSATGQLTVSEDLAQEAFIDAWRQLPKLREPAKLRPWLCGILRFKISRLRRADGREPVRQAESLDEGEDLTARDKPAADVAIQKEEQAILWKALERVPETYREPLILFYREHRSVEHVAAALDLSEDAVKQRLARGRRLLQDQVLAFVEGALARTTPGRVFTLAVLAALPQLAPPAKAAALGAFAAQGGVMAKTTSLAALLSSLSGAVNFLLAMRASLDQSRTPLERRTAAKAVVGGSFGSVAFLAVIYALREAAGRWPDERVALAVVTQVLVIGFALLWPLLMVRMLRSLRRLRTAERRLRPEYFRDARDQIGSSAGEYRSRARLCGVPLVHLRFAMAEVGDPPVVGWIAAGDRAFGLLFAWGVIAIAPISVGVVSVGLFSVSVLGVGLVGLGTVAFGWLTIGCITVGVKAYAWLSALGWETAQSGGFAVARLAAEGPVALARHANDPAARLLLADPNAERNQMLFFIVMLSCSLVPLVLYANEVRRRLGGGAPPPARRDGAASSGPRKPQL